MATSCPACATSVAAGASHCPKCGFPIALAGALHGPLPPPPAEPDGAEAPSALPELPVRRRDPRPDADVTGALARALEQRTELLATLDPEAPDVTAELCEAALNEASGRVADAQQVLRSAEGRLDRETEELLGRHLADLESRGKALEATGLRLALEEELGRLAETLVADAPATSIAGLLAAERRVARIEAHWRGLQALLAQVTTLREEAADLGVTVDARADRLQALRANLGSIASGERELDAVAQAAAEALMALHEAIPPALEQELARHRATLDAHPSHLPRSRSARRLHAEAKEHLAEGRLEGAVQSVHELRKELVELAREAKEAAEAEAARPPPVPAAPPSAAPSRPRPVEAPTRIPRPAPAPAPLPEVAPPEPAPPEVVAAAAEAPVAPAPPAPEPAVPDAEAVAMLLKKARGLAARVRALPAESEEALSAARQIHEATELLRARRFAEADAALTRLMRALAVPTSRS